MILSKDIKWLLFDFGGCLDSDGVHSRTLFFEHFKKTGLIDNLEKFQSAYTLTDKMITSEALLIDSNLSEMNQIMCSLIAQNLSLINKDAKINEVAKSITQYQSYYLNRNKTIIKKLQVHFKMGIVSNFSGNLVNILKEFDLFTHFNFVLDSFHVGHSKPSLEIFRTAINRCDSPAKTLCFIGDNNDRDILPAKELGMNTIYINTDINNSRADYSITRLFELLDLSQST